MPGGHRVAVSHPWEELLDDPSIDPSQEIFGAPEHEGLHEHQGRAEEEGEERAIEGNLQCRRHTRQIVQEAVEVLDHRQDEADVHQGLRDPLDGPDESDDGEKVEDVAREGEAAGHLLLVEGRGLSIDLHELGHRRRMRLLEEACELPGPDLEDADIVLGDLFGGRRGLCRRSTPREGLGDLLQETGGFLECLFIFPEPEELPREGEDRPEVDRRPDVLFPAPLEHQRGVEHHQADRE